NTLRFQLDGHEAAFRSAEVAAAIEGGPHGAIAVTLAVYAGPGEIEVVVPWRRIASAAEADSLADAIDAARVPAPDGSTALGSATLGAAALLADGPGGLPERRIDIVGNGFSNAGIDPAAARDLVVADGITVNALAIVNEFPWLEEYYAGQV